MKHTLWIITLLILINTTAFAQEETAICASPFVNESTTEDIILSVNETHISADAFVNRFHFESAYNIIKYNIRVAQINEQARVFNLEPEQLMATDTLIQKMNAELTTPELLATRVLEELTNEALIRQYAEANNLSVSSDTLNDSIANFFSFSEETTSDEREVTIDNFNQNILTSGTTQEEIITFYCRTARYDLVQETVIGDVQTTLYADLDHILVSSEEVAQDIITLIDSGEDFATLAQELSLDTASAQRGGNLSDIPVILYVPEFADAVINGDLNTILAPVQTQFGWHVIRINNKEERAIDETYNWAVRQSLFTGWQEEQLANATVTLNPDWQSFIPGL